MKIALIHAHSWPEIRRPPAGLVDDLAAYLRGRGHQVDFFAGTRGESVFNIAKEGRTYRLRMPRISALGPLGITTTETFALRAVAPLLLHRYDVVHAFAPTIALVAAVLRQRTVLTVTSPRPRDARSRRLMPRSVLRRAAAHATKVAAFSREAAGEVEQRFSRIAIVLPPAIWVDRYEPNLEPRTGPPVVLYSGELARRDNGLPRLFEAFGRLRDPHPEARLVLVGTESIDWALSEIRSLRSRIEDAVDVVRPATLTDPAEHYRSATVTVLPSDQLFSLTAIESLAAGTPVVALSPGPCDDILAGANAGILVDDASPQKLGRAIEASVALAREPQTAATCRSHSERWDWAHVGPQYESHYAKIACAGVRR